MRVIQGEEEEEGDFGGQAEEEEEEEEGFGESMDEEGLSHHAYK